MWRGRSPFDHDRLRQERGRRLRRPLTTTVLVQSAQPPAASRPAAPAEVTTPASRATANDYGQNAAQNYRTPSFARPLHPVHRWSPRRLISIEISQVRPGIRWPIRGARATGGLRPSIVSGKKPHQCSSAQHRARKKWRVSLFSCP